MPRFPVHTIDDAPPASRAALQAAQRKHGRLLNITAEMAHAPAVIAAYAAMNEAIAEHGTFGPATREAIALAVGNQDGCGYCQSAHTLSALRAGLTQEQTIAIRNADTGFDPKLGALLAVAREIAGNTGEVAEETYQRAQAAGWASEELAELYAHVAANMFTNYFNDYAHRARCPRSPGIAA